MNIEAMRETVRLVIALAAAAVIGAVLCNVSTMASMARDPIKCEATPPKLSKPIDRVRV